MECYDYGARLQDPQIGKFFTQDRFSEKYYPLSPYQYGANDPIRNIDVNGDSIWVTVNTQIANPDGSTTLQTNRFYYGRDNQGNYGFLDPSTGKLYSGDNNFLTQASNALGNLRSGTVGKNLVDYLASSSKNTEIAYGVKNYADEKSGAYVLWNENGAPSAPDQKGNTNPPAYIGLGHELAHIQDIWQGTINRQTWRSVKDVTGNVVNITNAELYATHMENQIRAEHNIPLREFYGVTPDRQGDPSTRIIRSNTNKSLYYDSNGNTNYQRLKRNQVPFTY